MNLTSGAVLQSANLAQPNFGEGITVSGALLAPAQTRHPCRSHTADIVVGVSIRAHAPAQILHGLMYELCWKCGSLFIRNATTLALVGAAHSAPSGKLQRSA